MSTTTLMNALPKPLREELKSNHMYDACFTNVKRTTVTFSHASMVPTGIEQMIENRQELLLLGYTTRQTLEAQVGLLRDIEVLRFTLSQLKKESR